MRKKRNKIKTISRVIGIVGILLCIEYWIGISSSNVSYAAGNEGADDALLVLDEEGNIEVVPSTEIDLPDFTLLEELEIDTDPEGALQCAPIQCAPMMAFSLMTRVVDNRQIIVEPNATNHGVVVFKNKDASVVTSYANARTRASGYLNAVYAPDAAYLGTITENGVKKVIFKQSGVIGIINADSVSVIDYDVFRSKNMITSHYEVKNGKLYHNITTNLETTVSTQLFGYKQEYMQEGKTYYSYDGHYFYEDYKKMTADYCTGGFENNLYKEGTYQNAINPTKPYYNYFMYLSQRSKTNVTGEQLDAYLKNHATYKETSKLANMGQAFIDNQNTYGANALIMYATAINESAYGNSSIAQKKNNLFGHGASDAYPGYSATGYGSPSDSIKDHAQVYISKGYTDPKDGRYYGSHLGNKESGANVRYASDSYWGEKAAAHCFYIAESVRDSVNELDIYSIGICTEQVVASNSQGTELYNSLGGTGEAVLEYPVIVLEEMNGKYQIQSDAPLDDTQMGLQQVLPGGDTGLYEFDKDIVYIEKGMVRYLVDNTVVKPEVPQEPEYVLGDASGEGNITSLDYIQIKNHIMGVKLIPNERLKAADASRDGIITSLDYVKIKNHIMGIKLLV